MSDELNEVRPGDRITADLVNTLIRRVKAPSTGGEGSITVPALFGLPLPSARDSVRNAGLVVAKVLDAYGRELDSTQPTPQPPVVISQVPAPGVRVNANHGVLIAVSAQATTGGTQPAPGPSIPDLMHKTLTEAQTLLSQRSIQSDQIDVLDVFGRPVGSSDPHKNDRRVISQVPLPGTPVSQIFSVKLVTTEVAGPLMPTLVGLKLVDAKARLIQANILADIIALDVAGKPVDPADSRFNDRLVVNQLPPPGSQTKVISAVNLVTTMDVPATGTPVPNLIHVDLATAKTRLGTAAIPLSGVLIRDVFGVLVDPNDSQNNDRLILNQLPLPGAPVRESMSMNLVATGRPTTTTPPPGGGTPSPSAPQIIALYPAVTPSDTEIRIVGGNFASNPLANLVTIGGIQVIPSPESTTSTLFVVVPYSLGEGVPSTGEQKPVVVTTLTGQATSSITVQPPGSYRLPQITSISPPTGMVGEPVSVRATTGTYNSYHDHGYLTFDGIAASHDTHSPYNLLIPGTIPGIEPGTSKSVFARIRVDNRWSPAFAYTVTRPLPTLQSQSKQASDAPDAASSGTPPPSASATANDAGSSAPSSPSTSATDPSSNDPSPSASS